MQHVGIAVVAIALTTFRIFWRAFIHGNMNFGRIGVVQMIRRTAEKPSSRTLPVFDDDSLTLDSIVTNRVVKKALLFLIILQ